MVKRISDDEWEAIKRNTLFFNRNSSIIEECRGEFGTINLFKIVSAAELVEQRGGISNVTSKAQVKRCCVLSFKDNHTDRFSLDELAGARGDQIRARAQLFGAIKWLLADDGTWNNLSLQHYIAAMDTNNLWDVMWEAGAKNDDEFEHIFPLSMRETIEQQPQYAPSHSSGCHRCGGAHLAKNCPRGGEWERGPNGQLVRRGGCPRCMCCHINTSEHNSTNCPKRHPYSYLPVDRCPYCKRQLQGSNRMKPTCVFCNQPLRCWNCGNVGHRLNQCPAPPYAGASTSAV